MNKLATTIATIVHRGSVEGVARVLVSPGARASIVGGLLFSTCAVAVAADGSAVREWNFNRSGVREGWSVPEELTGAVMGGSLWLTPSPRETDPAELASANYQFYGDYNPVRRSLTGEQIRIDGPAEDGALTAAGPDTRDIESPRSLNLSWPTGQQLLARVRVLNLSPATSLLLRWRAAEDKLGTWRSSRCALKPDFKPWQDLECEFNAERAETLDQIAIGVSENVIRGDLWIDQIAIASGPIRAPRARPDVASATIIPKVSIPGLQQTRFAAAFAALDALLVVDVPAYGFPYPYMKASGDNQYGDYPWPQIDSVIAASASAWSNQAFAEDVLRGVAVLQAQNPDGRISGFPWEPLVGQPSDVGVRPDRFFVSAHMIALRSRDREFRQIVFEMMDRYLSWYLSPTKRDQATGLVMGDWEDAVGSEGPNFSPGVGGQFNPQTQARAPVILNAAVVIGAELTADLGAAIGATERASAIAASATELSKAINRHLWDEQDGFYYDLDVTSLKLSKKDPAVYAGGGRQSGAFFTLGRAAPSERGERLLQRLTSAEFNWTKGPLSDASLEGGPDVQRPRVWGAKMWALTNVPVIDALESAGRHDLAAELNWKFLQLIKSSYSEHFLMDGKPIGGKPYSFTASAMIDGVVGHLFGVEYRGVEGSLKIAPALPQALFNKEISITNLILPTGGDTRLSIEVRQKSACAATIRADISGPLPKGQMTIELPQSGKTMTVPAQASFTYAQECDAEQLSSS
jgi:hypothetical protein